jgi:hypothetical protein
MFNGSMFDGHLSFAVALRALFIEMARRRRIRR